MMEKYRKVNRYVKGITLAFALTLMLFVPEIAHAETGDIITQPTEDVELYFGQSVTFECEVEGATEYNWGYFNSDGNFVLYADLYFERINETTYQGSDGIVYFEGEDGYAYALYGGETIDLEMMLGTRMLFADFLNTYILSQPQYRGSSTQSLTVVHLNSFESSESIIESFVCRARVKIDGTWTYVYTAPVQLTFIMENPPKETILDMAGKLVIYLIGIMGQYLIFITSSPIIIIPIIFLFCVFALVMLFRLLR